VPIPALDERMPGGGAEPPPSLHQIAPPPSRGEPR